MFAILRWRGLVAALHGVAVPVSKGAHSTWLPARSLRFPRGSRDTWTCEICDRYANRRVAPGLRGSTQEGVLHKLQLRLDEDVLQELQLRLEEDVQQELQVRLEIRVQHRLLHVMPLLLYVRA